MRNHKRRIAVVLLLLAALLTACGSEKALTMVASYPRATSAWNSAPAAVGGPVVEETVSLTLVVHDPDSAAADAANLARGYGGYETDRYAWESGAGRIVSQELFIPLGRADAFRTQLARLGMKSAESVVRNVGDGYGHGEPWTQFSIRFVPSPPPAEWDRPHDDWDYPDGGWGHSLRENFLRAVCGFIQGAAAVAVQWAAALLLAAAVVIPCGWLVVGAVTTIRWLFRRER